MLATIIRKDWHHYRRRAAAYALLLQAPMLALAVLVWISPEARLPFAELNDGNILQHLPLTLAVALAIPTVFQLWTGALAVRLFHRSSQPGTEFLLHEQPISAAQFVTARLWLGLGVVAVSVALAVLLAVAGGWGLMLASGRVSWAGSYESFQMVMAAAGRCCVWCVVLSWLGFTGSALVAAVAPRWWMAAVGMAVFVVTLLLLPGDLFDFTPTTIPSESLSVAVDFHWGVSKPWVAMSRPLTAVELQDFGTWRAGALALAMGLTAVFAGVLRTGVGLRRLAESEVVESAGSGSEGSAGAIPPNGSVG